MTTTDTKHFLTGDAGWQDIGPGIRRKLLGYDPGIMMVVVRFEKGAVGALHEHPHRQATYVAEGEFEITISGETQMLLPGDGFFVPSGALHAAVALTAGTLIDVFAPAREDFLKS